MTKMRVSDRIKNGPSVALSAAKAPIINEPTTEQRNQAPAKRRVCAGRADSSKNAIDRIGPVSPPSGPAAHATPAVPPAPTAMQTTPAIAPAAVPACKREVTFCETGGQWCHRHSLRFLRCNDRPHMLPPQARLNELGAKTKKLIFGNRARFLQLIKLRDFIRHAVADHAT
jgi:hypothetical protein